MDMLIDTFNGRALVSTTTVTPDADSGRYNRTRINWLDKNMYSSVPTVQSLVIDLPFNDFVKAAQAATASGRIPDFTNRAVEEMKSVPSSTKPKLQVPQG